MAEGGGTSYAERAHELAAAVHELAQARTSSRPEALRLTTRTTREGQTGRPPCQIMDLGRLRDLWRKRRFTGRRFVVQARLELSVHVATDIAQHCNGPRDCRGRLQKIAGVVRSCQRLVALLALS